MGLMSEISSFLGFSRRETKILVIGLDNSGKTTILNHLKPAEAQSTQASVAGRYRNLWESHARDVQGIVFVVDSSDHLRMAVAKDELWIFLEYRDIATRRIPLLIFANKMDEKGAMDPFEVNLRLGLNLIRSRNWNICASCALSGQGLSDGMKWLGENIRSYLDGKG